MIKNIFFLFMLLSAKYLHGKEKKDCSISKKEKFSHQENEQSDPRSKSRFSLLNQELFHDDVPDGYVQDTDALPKVK